MSTKTNAGNWKSIVGAVKEKFGEFTGDELSRAEGNLDQLISLVQQKSGESREWVEDFISNAGGNAQDVAHRVSKVASDYANQATDVIRDNYEYLADGAQRGYDNTLKTVSRRPMESVAIALGCGVLTGLIVGLSMASKRHYR
ncbi:MAG: CsbD family protein [Pirellulaceae bacterium]|nr:CsbD family protein [Pirellulaceae bacterium]